MRSAEGGLSALWGVNLNCRHEINDVADLGMMGRDGIRCLRAAAVRGCATAPLLFRQDFDRGPGGAWHLPPSASSPLTHPLPFALAQFRPLLLVANSAIP